MSVDLSLVDEARVNGALRMFIALADDPTLAARLCGIEDLGERKLAVYRAIMAIGESVRP